MVRSYAETMAEDAIYQGRDVLIFLEPKVGTSYPDLVAVYWNPRKTELWTDLRKNLSSNDLRVLHYIWITGQLPEKELISKFRGLNRSLDMLTDCNIVQIIENTPVLNKDTIFAVEKIIAIEGKISKWKEGLKQAIQNISFASESYLLLERWPKNAEFLENRARDLGIGLLKPDIPVCCTEIFPPDYAQPSSYASWLFNEMCWQFHRGYSFCEQY